MSDPMNPTKRLRAVATRRIAAKSVADRALDLAYSLDVRLGAWCWAQELAQWLEPDQVARLEAERPRLVDAIRRAGGTVSSGAIVYRVDDGTIKQTLPM